MSEAQCRLPQPQHPPSPALQQLPGPEQQRGAKARGEGRGRTASTLALHMPLHRDTMASAHSLN